MIDQHVSGRVKTGRTVMVAWALTGDERTRLPPLKGGLKMGKGRMGGMAGKQPLCMHNWGCPLAAVVILNLLKEKSLESSRSNAYS